MGGSYNSTREKFGMQSLFKSLASANLILLLIVAVWGCFPRTSNADVGGFDVLSGMTAVLCALFHSIVYTYFIASGKFAETAVDERGFPDKSVVGTVKGHKRQAFRYGFLAILATMTAVFLYYASSPVRGPNAIGNVWGIVGGFGMVLINLWATLKEWKFVAANGVLMDEILRVLGSGPAAPAPDGV